MLLPLGIPGQCVINAKVARSVRKGDRSLPSRYDRAPKRVLMSKPVYNRFCNGWHLQFFSLSVRPVKGGPLEDCKHVVQFRCQIAVFGIDVLLNVR